VLNNSPSSEIPASSAFGSSLPLSVWAESANFRSTDWNASNHVIRKAVNRQTSHRPARSLHTSLPSCAYANRDPWRANATMNSDSQIDTQRWICKVIRTVGSRWTREISFPHTVHTKTEWEVRYMRKNARRRVISLGQNVPQIRRLVAGFPPRRPGSSPDREM
jgi:hypothetical protein